MRGHNICFPREIKKYLEFLTCETEFVLFLVVLENFDLPMG